MMSDNLTWNPYLWGKDKIAGLLHKLSKRVGVLGELNKLMTTPGASLKLHVVYALPVCSTVFHSLQMFGVFYHWMALIEDICHFLKKIAGN